jgi:hypothetical protein
MIEMTLKVTCQRGGSTFYITPNDVIHASNVEKYLKEHNARFVKQVTRRYLEFDSEADFIMFVLKYS